jgi:hypothetical protein
MFPKGLAAALLICWNIAFVSRSIASRRHWVAVCAADRFFTRVFATGATPKPDVRHNDVIELEAREIVSLSIKAVEIIWPRTRPTVVKFLRIKVDQDVERDLAKLSQILSNACDMDQGRSVGFSDDSLFI